ncbi:hypothetical protein SPRG_14696 [Saprolegnia parasitica CBS 223.65]|uniref:PX domain-containing protein n=1 Tax=Saprolegnia parasitica (strain CBS 223.65) TaxID=695850 RepID=A0A067BLF4_SAPPC|nr:hypothetical protein SPRG_14696 [Saprolegnia parasitica CBS 223.65]KDO19304.1 hypothetical protein SPRG_14696 [Saprolegnia parasitica CBS 223.65]|eukprot:XP_012209978.1 hypothetical protein SPRG_14696 [Saprolegnia parasitica CBS 223.65]
MDLGTIAHGMLSARCRITGASICRRKTRGFHLSAHTVVYHVKVVAANGDKYVLDWSHDDFARLYKRLRALDASLKTAIAAFPCPKRTLFFGRHDALSIKGMCGQLECHLVAILKIGAQCAATSRPLQASLDACLLCVIASTVQPAKNDLFNASLPPA